MIFTYRTSATIHSFLFLVAFAAALASCGPAPQGDGGDSAVRFVDLSRARQAAPLEAERNGADSLIGNLGIGELRLIGLRSPTVLQRGDEGESIRMLYVLSGAGRVQAGRLDETIRPDIMLALPRDQRIEVQPEGSGVLRLLAFVEERGRR